MTRCVKQLQGTLRSTEKAEGKFIFPLEYYKQVWLWPYKAPGVVESGSYDITIVCGPRDMRLKKYVLISQKYSYHNHNYEFLYRVDGTVYPS